MARARAAVARRARTVDRLTDSLGADRLASRQAQGRTCTDDQIVAIALEAIDRVTAEEQRAVD
jgi:hypothetical protein